MSPAIRLRPLRCDDRDTALAAHEAMKGDEFPFLLGYEPDMPWDSYVSRLADHSLGVNLPPDHVRSALLLATARSEIVGRASIRYQLNDYLAAAGGHIGYCVLPQHRRQGFATEILRQSLIIARAGGVEDVLVTCDVENAASATVIERCGGVFDGLVDDPYEHVRKRRYWIP